MVKDFKDCNVYEIYPNNFCDTNEDGYGDINGIIKKLDYIKDLGFKAIWVNSLYESKYLDGGYDVTDFYKISPRYGTMEDFENLLNEVHKRQMLFIMELIPGHASIYHPDFVRSSLPTKNEMSDLFIWTDDPWSWYDDCQLIRGCYDRSGAYVINFFAHQAAINYGYNKITHPSWQMSYKDKRVLQARYYLEDIMRFYLKKGVDGFRVDMADSLVKNDGTTKEATIWLWQQIRKDLKKDFPNFVMTSEWCEPNQALQAGFDSDFVLDHNDNFLHYLFRERTKDGQNIPLLHKFLDRFPKLLNTGHITVLHRIHNAVVQVIHQKYFSGIVDRRAHCRQLNQNIRTVFPPVYHPFDRFQVADGFRQTVGNCLRVGVDMSFPVGMAVAWLMRMAVAGFMSMAVTFPMRRTVFLYIFLFCCTVFFLLHTLHHL